MRHRVLFALLLACPVVAPVRAQADLVPGHPRYVVYGAGSWPDGQEAPDSQIYRADTKTGKAITLHDLEVTGGVIDKRIVDPRGRHVVFRAMHGFGGLFELYRSTIKKGALLKLSGPQPAGVDGVDHRFQVDPKGRYAVYTAQQDAAGVDEIYRSTLKTGKVLKLNAPLVEGGDVSDRFVLDPRGRYALYVADQDSDDVFELYRSRLKTGQVLKLSPPTVGGGVIPDSMVVDPQGSTVIYMADVEGDGTWALYRSSLAKGQPTQVSGDMAAGGGVSWFEVYHAQKWVLYTADQEVDGVFELFRTDLTTGENVKVSGPLAEGGEVQQWVFSPEHDQVVYIVDRDEADTAELYGVELSTGTVTQLSEPGAYVNSVLLDPKQRYAVWTAWTPPEFTRVLSRVDLEDGSVLNLSGPMVEGGEVILTTGDPHYPVTPDSTGRWVVWAADAETDDVLELYRADLETGERLKLNGPLLPHDEVGGFGLDPMGRYVALSTSGPNGYGCYLSDIESGALTEIVAPGSGKVAGGFTYTPDGQFVYFSADLDTTDTLELYRRDLGTGETIKVSGPLPEGWSVGG